ncbi:hypothetical protein K1T71_015104 [Dendrolimus kikuchii]|nr:hypothetical protein K1T71_015104 [Dendrolimus kikuchii]
MMFNLINEAYILCNAGSQIPHSFTVGDYCVVKYTNEKGHCQKFEDCSTAKKDLKNGYKTTYCSGTDESGRLLVCCRDSSLETDGVECEEYTKKLIESASFVTLTVEPVKILTDNSLCKFAGNALIIGGIKTEPEEFPHMAAIFYRDADTYKFLCTGSLISYKFVLTAGHCNQSTEQDKSPERAALVRLGDLNIGQTPAPPRGCPPRSSLPPTTIAIRKIHMHPEYLPPVVYNDIALLELERTVAFTPAIRPACLWTQNGVGHYVKGTATGWGVTDLKHPKPSEVLMKLLVPFRENKLCDEKLFSERGLTWDGFTDTQLCAGDLDGGHDTCYGDSGGPIQVESRNNKCNYYLVGVTSVGKGCGEKDHPSIYTRVSSYLDWIEGIVWPDGSDS